MSLRRYSIILAVKLAILIPAYNEEKHLAACLQSVKDALAACARQGLSAEVVVCDNASTDKTAEIARAGGAEVVFEPVRQIGRSRNAAAAACDADWLLFIDADSQLEPRTLEGMLGAAFGGRCVGGGCLVDFDRTPWQWALVRDFWNLLSWTFGLAAGSFLFCRADAFRAVGGFSQELYAAEEVELSGKLKRWGRARRLGFVILPGCRHVSSGRKFELYSWREYFRMILGALFSPRSFLKDPRKLPAHYDGRR